MQTGYSSSLRAILVPALSLLALAGCAAAANAAEPSKNLLVFYSNTRLLPANIAIDRGLRETLANAPQQRVELYTEFFDVPRFSGADYARTIDAYLREKYRQHPPDAIVAAGNEALSFILENRAQLFPDVPVVHVAVGREFLLSNAPLPDDLIGVPVDFDSVANIELALGFHPNATRLVLVTGTSEWDREWEARLRSEAPRYAERVEVEFLSGLPAPELAARLAALGPESVVFSPGYFSDGTGRAVLPRQAIELIAKASPAPVYGPYDTFIGSGVVGGRMPGYEDMGRQVASIALELFAGAAPASLRLPAVTPTELQIDWRQAQRFGIREQDLPADAILHFKEPTLWQAYRGTVLTSLAVIALQTGLIAALLVERRRRRQTRSALEQSERRMSLATHAAGLSIWTWDEERGGAGAALEAVHPNDRAELDKAMRDALRTNDALNVEYRVARADGEVRWLAAYGHAEDGSRTRLLGVARDVTEHKLSQLQAERDRTAIRHLGRVSMLGQLSASIAHQLNQPLAAILGNAEAARTVLGREPVDLVELREICDDIVTEDNRAAEVIRRLRALYQRGELELATLDLNALVGEVLELARTDLLLRHVTPLVTLAPDLPSVSGDRVQLQQVLLNLIVNAADAMSAMPESERVLDIRTDGTKQVRIAIRDRGPGIDEADLRSIFDPFFSTKPSGMGVGLAICRSIMDAHGGSVSAANLPAGGAEFQMSLPASEPT